MDAVVLHLAYGHAAVHNALHGALVQQDALFWLDALLILQKLSAVETSWVGLCSIGICLARIPEMPPTNSEILKSGTRPPGSR